MGEGRKKSNKKFFEQSQSEIRNRSEEESWGTPVDYTSIFFHSPSSFISPLKILGKSRSDNNKAGTKRELWLFESKTVGLAPLNLLNFESGNDRTNKTNKSGPEMHYYTRFHKNGSTFFLLFIPSYPRHIFK